MSKYISLFRYPGGKSKISVREKILSYAPMFYSEFRSPFVGGGGIFWTIDPGIKRWINDIDDDLIAVYMALRDRPKEFIAKCRAIETAKDGEPLTSAKPGGKKIYNARLKEVFDELIANPDSDKALKYFFINRTVWEGRVNYDMPSRLYYSNPNGWNIIDKNTLDRAADAIKDTKITSQGYEEVLSEDGDDVWIYLDPPYYVNSKLSKSSKLYKNNFTIAQHIKLAKDIKNCKHKILMSYDDDDENFIRDLYDGFNIYEEEWIYCGTSNKKKKIGREIVITNYDKI
jgi:DNA adenine methylase